jgi:hypothetical protein
VLLGLLCLFVLCATLLVLRGGSSAPPGAAAWRVPPSRRELVGGALLVLASCLPLFLLAPYSRATADVFAGDSASHAKVALEIARYGLPHGWLDSYLGGFPFGHHYPPLGWLLLASGLSLGLSPGVAINGLGLLATLATPLSMYTACVRAGARPLHAACAGCLLSLVSPYNPFIGGHEVFFSVGLLSQAVALPLCISCAAAAARGARGEATIVAALAMSAHPQLGVATFVLIGGVAVLDGARGRRGAVACALGSAVLTGAALYGQGLRTLRVPFGWPPGLGWRQVGFGTARLVWWFRDGDLLDNESKIPAITALAGAAVLLALLLIKRRATRALLLATLAALALSSAGRALLKQPGWGAWLLEFAQPLRVLALLAPLLAALLAAALEEAAAALRSSALPRGRRWRRLALLAGPGISLCVLALAAPTRVRTAQQLRQARVGPAAECKVEVPGFDRAALAAWFRSLRGGSVWFSEGEGVTLDSCLLNHGIELASAVPIGSTSAVGSHVGVLAAAAKQLQPQRAGAAHRAAALGVRYVVRDMRKGPGLAPDFTRRAASGVVELLELPHVQRAHLGCVRQRWSGSDRALREKLMRELVTPEGADHLLDPESFVELVPAPGDVVVSAVDTPCDATSASLRVVEHAPGRLEALVESAAPVDVAFKVTAFPAWRVSVDGSPGVPAGTVAPGHVYARLAAGRHRVVATASTLPGYGAWLALAAIGVAALAWLDTRHLRAAGHWLRQLAKQPLE